MAQNKNTPHFASGLKNGLKGEGFFLRNRMETILHKIFSNYPQPDKGVLQVSPNSLSIGHRPKTGESKMTFEKSKGRPLHWYRYG